MATYLERIGVRQPRSLVQSRSFDEATRNALSNVIYSFEDRLDELSFHHRVDYQADLGIALWKNHYVLPLRNAVSPGLQAWTKVHQDILNGDWESAIATIEFLAGKKGEAVTHLSSDVQAFRASLNDVFQKYLVNCRFIGDDLVPVDDADQIEALNKALDDTGAYSGIRSALKSAAALLSDRQNPDYLKSISASIGAVEAVVRFVTGENTLGSGLAKLRKKGVEIHPALEKGWSSIYGYSSDQSGIRHHSVEATDADQDLALYFLVSCSAFVSYLLKKTTAPAADQHD